MSITEKRSLSESSPDGFKRVEKKSKRQKKLDKGLKPEFHFLGQSFSQGRQLVGIKDVRDFCLGLLLGNGGNEQNWIQVSHWNLVQHVVLVFVPGITPAALGIDPPRPKVSMPQRSAAETQTSRLPIIPKLFTHYCPTRAPGDYYKMHSCVQTLLTAPVPPKEKETRQKERLKQWNKDKTPANFLLTKDLMQESLYTIPTYGVETPLLSTNLAPATGNIQDWKRPDGSLQTPLQQISPVVKIFAIDCEMVTTEDGLVLARISMVNQEYELVYDTLVMPEKSVLDYATQYSGITEARLKGVTTTLAQVQEALIKLIDYNTILVGHSLDNDLRVLHLAHPWVIDTSVLYHHTRGPPFKPSLKWLAQKWLSKEIQVPHSTEIAGQEGVIIGHDSKEDATAAMELLNLKLEKGPGFGEFSLDMEPIFDRLARCQKPRTSLVVDHGQPDKWHGSKATKSVPCTNDEQVLDGLLKNVSQYDFTFARFLDLSHALEWSQPSAAVGKLLFQSDATVSTEKMGAPDATDDDAQEQRIEQAYNNLNTQLTRLHGALPSNTALVILTGHDDPRKMLEMSSKKMKFEKLYKANKGAQIAPEDRWMEQEDRELLELVEKTRVGMSFYCII